ncbi:MAG: hypothetical protein ACK4YF_02160 [Exilispira sp.]
MGIKEDIFNLINEFNYLDKSKSILEKYDIKDLLKHIPEYPGLNNLFEKFINENIDDVEASQLYFIISNSEIMLAIFNEYYNEKISQIVCDQIENEENIKKKNFDLNIIPFSIYKNRLISPFQYFNFAPISGDEENNKTIFLSIPFDQFDLIISLKYRDEKFDNIEKMRIILKKDFDLEGKKNANKIIKNSDKKINDIEYEIEIKTIFKVYKFKLKIDECRLIEGTGRIEYIKYKEKIYKFDEPKKITEKSIAITINIKENLLNNKMIKNFLNEEFSKIIKDGRILYEIFTKSKYIKITYKDKELFIPFIKLDQSYIDNIIDYILNEFDIKN